MTELYDEPARLRARLTELQTMAGEGTPVAAELDEALQALEELHAQLGLALSGGEREGVATERR